MTLWGHEKWGHWSNFSIVTRYLRVIRMVFVQKRRFSVFSGWLIMERTQYWPDLRSPDMKILRRTFYRHCYLYHSLKVSRQSFSRCRFDEHSNFLWGEVTGRDLVTWPCLILVWNFHNICGKIHDKVCQKQRLCAPPFSGNLKKNGEGRLSKAPPPPSGRGLN